MSKHYFNYNGSLVSADWPISCDVVIKQYVKFYSSLRFFVGPNKSGSSSLILPSIDGHCHFAVFSCANSFTSFILLSLSLS